MLKARYLIGIDLGTSNIALSYCDYQSQDTQIHLFKIPQLIASGQVADLSLLPAYYLYADPKRFDLKTVLMPWQTENAIIGYLAKEYAYDDHNSSISSAKSYLSHPVMDITTPFLPLGGTNVDAKSAPFDVIVSYLRYLIGAWNEQHKDDLLQAQEVVITIPASFDEKARQYTLKAANQAGFKHVKLLEEPLAAFYHWLSTHKLEDPSIDQTVKALALVIDIGGGTSDFSLIQLTLSPKGAKLSRIATGKHLLIGGDNMNHFLLNRLISKQQKAISRTQKAKWLNQIQKAKETFLTQLATDKPPTKINLSLSTNKAKLLKDTISTTLTLEDIEALADGFFPHVSFNPIEKKPTHAGLRQFGLPFEANPKITEHIADFLYQNQNDARHALDIDDQTLIPIPEVILLNGGIFHSPYLTKRTIDVIKSWHQKNHLETEIEILHNDNPSLAVSYGATAFLKAKYQDSLLIETTAKAHYFIQVGENDALCVLTKGAKEGISYPLNKHKLTLKSDQTLSFPLFSKKIGNYQLNDKVNLTDDFEFSGAVIIENNQLSEDQSVYLSSKLDQAGILNLTAHTKSKETYQFEFNLNHPPLNPLQSKTKQLKPLTQKLNKEKLQKTLTEFFLNKDQTLSDIKKALYTAYGDFQKWDRAFSRSVFDELFKLSHLRFKRPEKEQYFYTLSGLLLNPGFGFNDDQARISALTMLYHHGIEYHKEPSCVSAFLVMWRRVSPSLTQKMQLQLYDDTKHALFTRTNQLSQKNKVALDEKIRLLSTLEKLPLHLRIALFNQLTKTLSAKPYDRLYWWAIGRITNRQPLAPNPGELLPSDLIEDFLEKFIPIILQAPNKRAVSFIIHPLILMTRKLNDPAYMLDDIYQKKVIHCLRKLKATNDQIDIVKQEQILDSATNQYLYGDEFVLGLVL